MTSTVSYDHSPLFIFLVSFRSPLRLELCFPLWLVLFSAPLLTLSLPAQVPENAEGLTVGLRISHEASDAEDGRFLCIVSL